MWFLLVGDAVLPSGAVVAAPVILFS